MTARLLYAATSHDAICAEWVDAYTTDEIFAAQPGLRHAANALCSAQSGGSSGGGSRPKARASKPLSKRAQADKRAAVALQRQAKLEGERLQRFQQRRQVAAATRPRSKLYEQNTEQQKRRAERINAPREQRRAQVNTLESLRRKLARRYPDAVKIYNNSFNRLNNQIPPMVEFINTLPQDVISKVIKFTKKDEERYHSEGNAFYQKLKEAGYEPPFMVTENPFWYHEDPSKYGI